MLLLMLKSTPPEAQSEAYLRLLVLRPENAALSVDAFLRQVRKMGKEMKRLTARQRVPHGSYAWDDEKGITVYDKKRDYFYQAVQILHGPASMSFRKKCGLIVVAALNKELATARRLGGKK